MYALGTGGGCFCPAQMPVCYGAEWTGEEMALPSLELVDKQKDVYGETIYYIRDERGVTSMVHECNLDDFMHGKGVTELQEGTPFLYQRKSRKR